jgi:hypothetical protein
MSELDFESINIGTKSTMIETFRYQVNIKPDLSEIQGTLSIAHYHFPEILFNDAYRMLMASYFMSFGLEHCSIDDFNRIINTYENEGLREYQQVLSSLLSWFDKQ